MGFVPRIALFIYLLHCSGNSVAERELNFLVVGDWGGQDDQPYYTDGEARVAEAMGDIGKQVGSQFTISLGDNFYDNGVQSVNDPRFKETFEDVFVADSLQSRWFVVCGNHDHYGNCSAQIAYTNVSKRWFMPDFYYSTVFIIPGSRSKVEFVFIDTIILAGLTHPFIRTIPPSGPKSVSDAEQQWEWIENTLNSSEADWLIVCGHYPVWSVSHHGPTKELVDRLRPLLMQYNASVYFSGHDHNLQYIKEDESSVNYVVSGAGHETDTSMHNEDEVPKGSLKFFYAKKDHDQSHGGFNAVSISDTAMTIDFYSAKGKLHYNTTIAKTRWN